MYDDTARDRTLRIRLDAIASRPPGRRQAWLVEAGSWWVHAMTEKAAADTLAERLRVFLTHYEHARLLSFSRDAEAQARYDLVHRTTDWHDDDSVHEAAAYLSQRRPNRGDSQYGPDELYRYAAWQRAAQAAMEAGRNDFHEWASAHEKEFTLPRPTETVTCQE